MPTGRKYLSFREGFFVHPLHHLEKKRQIHQLQKKVPPMFLYWNFVNFPNSASQTATLNTSKTNPSPTKTMRSHSTPVGNISSEGISSLIGVSPVQCLIEARESASEWQAHQGSLNTYIYIYIDDITPLRNNIPKTNQTSNKTNEIYQKQIKQCQSNNDQMFSWPKNCSFFTTSESTPFRVHRPVCFSRSEVTWEANPNPCVLASFLAAKPPSVSVVHPVGTSGVTWV